MTRPKARMTDVPTECEEEALRRSMPLPDYSGIIFPPPHAHRQAAKMVSGASLTKTRIGQGSQQMSQSGFPPVPKTIRARRSVM